MSNSNGKGHRPVVEGIYESGSARDIARARRAEHSRTGRGSIAPSQPTRPPRLGTLAYAPKVVAAETHAGQRVTGSRIAQGHAVTGAERGLTLPVSGTQYIGADAGAAWRAGGPKVGLARTDGGAIVSGTLVRSKIRVTGDEAGSAIAITGEADGRIDDDVTARVDAGTDVSAQFARQTNPHRGAYANVRRSVRTIGSRERARQFALETTEGGLPVTGSAIGRSVRVSGDEAGACRSITGDQYLAPADRQADCGGRAATPAPGMPRGAQRPDPVSGAKVSVAQTWRGRRVTGIDVEEHPRVTGSAPGACAAVTGSPYLGADTTYRWCDDAAVDAAHERLLPRPPASIVTGDTPLHDAAVTGTARGAAREISGTPYYREAPPTAEAVQPSIERIDDRFSVRSPQRTAQLRAPADGGKITGSFAVGHGKVTGNLEFAFKPRPSADPNNVAARLRITGEGRSDGRAISGQAWTQQANVTDGALVGDRNPSERGGKPRAFAGACRFKKLASHEEPKHLVTGMFGYSSDSAAKVTLSGGAQG
jgi:hypothetical protein